MSKGAKVFVAGHRGMVGSAITRALRAQGYRNLVERTSRQLDLRDQAAVDRWFAKQRPDWVFLAAARVGGIHANNTYPAQFLYDNLAIQTNVIHSAWRHGTKKLLFLGSSCVYPKHAPQPLTEEYLLTGPLEPTNEWYAVAKIAGIRMCQAYRKEYGFDAISLMPTNLYGPGDNFDLENSHVLPALIRKFHEAKAAGHRQVQLWGSGRPRREFLHVDDLARACVHFMETYSSPDILNVGTGEDVTIRALATMIQKTVGHRGRIQWDRTRPDGTPRKLLDVRRAHEAGWRASIPFDEGLRSTYAWFLANRRQARLEEGPRRDAPHRKRAKAAKAHRRSR